MKTYLRRCTRTALHNGLVPLTKTEIRQTCLQNKNRVLLWTSLKFILLMMLCLYLLTRIVYIIRFNLHKQWSLFPVIWETANYSYPCILTYYRINALDENVWHANLFFMCRFITLKLLNRLTSINMCSWLGGGMVTLQTVV